MRQKGFVHIFLLISVILVSIGFLLFLALKNSKIDTQTKKTEVAQTSTTITPPLTPTSVLNETTNTSFYKYAYEIMGIESSYQNFSAMNALKPLNQYSDMSKWDTHTNGCFKYEIEHPPELTGGGSFFLRRNTKSFTPRIVLVDTQPWDIFNDKELNGNFENFETLTINDMKVKHSKYLELDKDRIKNYFLVYQYPNGDEFLHFVFNFISQDDELCSSFVDFNPDMSKAPKDYHPENIICKDDMNTKTKDDYDKNYATEVELFNKMAQTVNILPERDCPPVFSGGI